MLLCSYRYVLYAGLYGEDETDARKTEWTDCRLRDVVFDRTDLRDADFRGATDWIIDPAENRLHGARFDANDLTGLVQSLGIQLD